MKKGFTLIELLVVVLIIGILAAIALPQYEKAVEKTRMTEAIVQIKAITNAEQIYHLANGTYTTKWEDLDIELPGSVSGSQLTQNNLYFSLSNISLGYVYAGSSLLPDKNGKWWINGDLATGKLYCSTYTFDSKGKSYCKLWGGAEEDCVWLGPSSYFCYEIK